MNAVGLGVPQRLHLLKSMREAFRIGRVIDQMQFIRKTYGKKVSKATFYRHVKASFDSGEISKIFIEILYDGLRSPYPMGYEEVICIPRNREIEFILRRSVRSFEFKDLKMENISSYSKIIKIGAKALTNIKGLACRITLLDLSVGSTCSSYISCSANHQKDDLYAGEEIWLTLLQLKRSKDIVERIKEIRRLIENAKSQLSNEELEAYYRLRRELFDRGKHPSHDEIDEKGIYLGREIGGLLHLEMRLRQAEEDLEKAGVECFLIDPYEKNKGSYVVDFLKGEHAIMLIPQILHKGGIDCRPTIMIYNGWNDLPKEYVIRGYLSRDLIWVDPSLPANRKRVVKRSLETRLFRVSSSRSS